MSRHFLAVALLFAASSSASLCQEKKADPKKKDPALPLLANPQALADYHDTVMRRMEIATEGNLIARKKVLDKHTEELQVLVGRNVTWKTSVRSVDLVVNIGTMWHGNAGVRGSHWLHCVYTGEKLAEEVDREKLRPGSPLIIRGKIESVSINQIAGGHLEVRLKDVVVSQK